MSGSKTQTGGGDNSKPQAGEQANSSQLEIARAMAQELRAQMKEEGDKYLADLQKRHDDQLAELRKEIEALKSIKFDPPATDEKKPEGFDPTYGGRVDPDDFMEPRYLYAPRYATVVPGKSVNEVYIPCPNPDGSGKVEFTHMSTVTQVGYAGEIIQVFTCGAKITSKKLWKFLTEDSLAGFNTLYFDNPATTVNVNTGMLRRAGRHLSYMASITDGQQIYQLASKYNISDPFSKQIAELKMEIAAAMAREEAQEEMRLIEERSREMQREAQLAMR